MTDSNLANLLGLARTAQLAGNQEEALGYFNRVLEADPTISEAWIGKGKAAGWQSSLANIRLGEALVAFNHAIATAPETERGPTTAQVVEETNRLVAALYGIARNHLDEFVTLEGTWIQYLSQVSQLLDALEEVSNWEPLNRTTLENIVHLCKDNIEGVSYRDPYDHSPQVWHLSPEYESLLETKLAAAVHELSKIDPDYTSPSIEKKAADSCFVVTATMGDPYHPLVEQMRAFRDLWLLQRTWGKVVIAGYYKVGPYCARLIAQGWLMRKLSFFIVVAPLAWLAKRLMKNC